MKESHKEFSIIDTIKVKNFKSDNRLILKSIIKPDGSEKVKLTILLGLHKYYLKCEFKDDNNYNIISNLHLLPIERLDQNLHIIINQGLNAFYKTIPSCVQQNIEEEVELVGAENKAFTD